MNTKLKKQEKGFTIIEVLIVLAIAGLIMLIVFLAVPALQRNNRNTQRKNDVSALLGAVSEAVSNSSGALPDASKVAELSNLQYYADSAAEGEGNWNLKAATSTPEGTGTEDRAVIYTGATCDGGNAKKGPARAVVVVYGIEQSNGTFTSACVAS